MDTQACFFKLKNGRPDYSTHENTSFCPLLQCTNGYKPEPALMTRYSSRHAQSPCNDINGDDLEKRSRYVKWSTRASIVIETSSFIMGTPPSSSGSVVGMRGKHAMHPNEMVRSTTSRSIVSANKWHASDISDVTTKSDNFAVNISPLL